MKKIKISDDKYQIIGLDKTDVFGTTISIIKNGIVKCEYPICLIEQLGEINFPDNPISYDDKDKIEIIIKRGKK